MSTNGPTFLGKLLGRSRAALLALFYGRPDESFHLREIARRTGVTPGTAQRELRSLLDLGLVERTTLGHLVLYAAAKDTPVRDELVSVVTKTAGAAAVVRECLLPLADRIDCAFVFGSVARGSHQRPSDVDVFVVGSVNFTDLSAASSAAERRLQRQVNPTLYTPADLRQRLASANHFITAVLAGPKLFLIGDQHALDRLAGSQSPAAPSDLAKRNPGNPRQGRPRSGRRQAAER